MTIDRRKELLAKPYWDYHDIAEYFDCGTTKAIEIKKQAINIYDGNIKYMSQYAKIDSILKCFGTTRANEIEIINKL